MLKKILNNVQATIVFSFCTVSTIFWVTPLMVFALLKLVIPVTGFRRLMTRWIMAIGENWVSCNAAIFGFVNSTRWDVRGLEGLTNDQWYLVIANHQTWVDIIALQTVLNRRIPFLKFFIKQELIWFPFLGMAWWALDFPFMRRDSKAALARRPGLKGRDLEIARKACEKFRNIPVSMMNFPEGTRFSVAKRDQGKSPFQNLLLPRIGGMGQVLYALSDQLDALIDVTIIYPQADPAAAAPTFWDLLTGRVPQIVARAERRNIPGELLGRDFRADPQFRRDLEDWMMQMWEDKDALISQLQSSHPVASATV